MLSAFKKREKERVEQENGLLEQIRSVRILSAKTIDDVLSRKVRSTIQPSKYLINTILLLAYREHMR